MIDVKVLRTVRVAVAGNVYGREILAGTDDTVPDDAFEGLRDEGYVEAIGAAPPVPPADDTTPVIPDDWRDLHHMKLIALAKQFDDSVATKDAAVMVIEKALAAAAENKAIGAAPENKAV